MDEDKKKRIADLLLSKQGELITQPVSPIDVLQNKMSYTASTMLPKEKPLFGGGMVGYQLPFGDDALKIRAGINKGKISYGNSDNTIELSSDKNGVGLNWRGKF